MIKMNVKEIGKKVKEHVVRNRGFYGYCAGVLAFAGVSSVLDKVFEPKTDVFSIISTDKSIKNPLQLEMSEMDRFGKRTIKTGMLFTEDEAESICDCIQRAVNLHNEKIKESNG